MSGGAQRVGEGRAGFNAARGNLNGDGPVHPVQVAAEALVAVRRFVNITARNNNVAGCGVVVKFRVVVYNCGFAVGNVGNRVIGDMIVVGVGRAAVGGQKANAGDYAVLVNKFIINAGGGSLPTFLHINAVGAVDRFVCRVGKVVVVNDLSGNIAVAVVDGNDPLHIFVVGDTLFSELLTLLLIDHVVGVVRNGIMVVARGSFNRVICRNGGVLIGHAGERIIIGNGIILVFIELGQIDRDLIDVLSKGINMALRGNGGDFNGSVRVVFDHRNLCRRCGRAVARIGEGIRKGNVRRRSVDRTDRNIIMEFAVGRVGTCFLRRDIIVFVDFIRRDLQRFVNGKADVQSVMRVVAFGVDETSAAQNVVDEFRLPVECILNESIVVNNFDFCGSVGHGYKIICERHFKFRVSVQ